MWHYDEIHQELSKIKGLRPSFKTAPSQPMHIPLGPWQQHFHTLSIHSMSDTTRRWGRSPPWWRLLGNKLPFTPTSCSCRKVFFFDEKGLRRTRCYFPVCRAQHFPPKLSGRVAHPEATNKFQLLRKYKFGSARRPPSLPHPNILAIRRSQE